MRIFNQLVKEFPILFAISFIVWYPYGLYMNIPPPDALESFLPFIPAIVIIRLLYLILKGWFRWVQIESSYWKT